MCGADLLELGDSYLRSGSSFVSTTHSLSSGSSSYAPACTNQVFNFDDGRCGGGCFTSPASELKHGQGLGSIVEKVLVDTEAASCDGIYSYSLIGRLNSNYQVMAHLYVYFGDTYVRISRWVWNRAGEAGVDVGTHEYYSRFSWGIQNYTSQWFKMTLDIDTNLDTCTATYLSSTHSQSRTFACVLTDDVAPRLDLSGGTHGSHATNASILGVYSETGF